MNRRLELSLDHDLLKLAESFLTDDDMANLLRKLSDKVGQTRQAADHIHLVEDQKAEIFREKVSLGGVSVL